MKHYVVYKITNLLNNKIYIGCHQTSNLDDGYMGSGTRIRQAIEKHGVENFKKEFLHIFESAEEMFAKEAEIVNEEFLYRDDVYNLTTGGNGSWFSINSDIDARKEKNRRAAISMNKKAWDDHSFRERNKIRLTAQTKRLHKEGVLKAPDWTGKTHRKETKEKIGKANAVHQAGEGNSQFGKTWIFNESERKSIRVMKEDVDNWLKDGWKLGRKMKFDMQPLTGD